MEAPSEPSWGDPRRNLISSWTPHGSMPRRSAKQLAKDLPEPHRIVLRILADAERALTWDELRGRAAEKGIGEEELHLIMFGTPLP